MQINGADNSQPAGFLEKAGFVKANDPGQSCDGPAADASLETDYARLVTLALQGRWGDAEAVEDVQLSGSAELTVEALDGVQAVRTAAENILQFGI